LAAIRQFAAIGSGTKPSVQRVGLYGAPVPTYLLRGLARPDWPGGQSVGPSGTLRGKDGNTSFRGRPRRPARPCGPSRRSSVVNTRPNSSAADNTPSADSNPERACTCRPAPAGDSTHTGSSKDCTGSTRRRAPYQPLRLLARCPPRHRDQRHVPAAARRKYQQAQAFLPRGSSLDPFAQRDRVG